jgi:co-chaperonin GroES (HSP10)
MSFIPFPDKIEIRPIKKEGVLVTEDPNLLEMGEVVAVGEKVTFAKPGDILFFVRHGMWVTAEVNGEKHYLVSEAEEFILGKNEKSE